MASEVDIDARRRAIYVYTDKHLDIFPHSLPCPYTKLCPEFSGESGHERQTIAQFNPQTFLKQVGNGKTTLTFPKKQILFSQGDKADAVFYIQAGKVKL